MVYQEDDEQTTIGCSNPKVKGGKMKKDGLEERIRGLEEFTRNLFRTIYEVQKDTENRLTGKITSEIGYVKEDINTLRTDVRCLECKPKKKSK